MVKKLITGNEAVAFGALRAGVKVATGYPGTPSTGCLASLLEMDLPGRHVEWSANEKVALEIAAGAAWAGQRALCTMKMSGVNVAYDSLCSIAYSGTVGGLVIYVADDPGASAGMVEQDSRGFARLTDLPMLEPASVAQAYTLTQAAFELSESCGAPVFLRLVGSIANSYAAVEVDEPVAPAERAPLLERDIARYTKAGAAIAMSQHLQAIGRLEAAGRIARAEGLNRLYLAPRVVRLEAMHGENIDATTPIPEEPDRLRCEVDTTLRQIQELLRPVWQMQESLPGPWHELLHQADEVLRAARHKPLAQAGDLLRQGKELLQQIGQAVPLAQPALRLAEEHLRLIEKRLPEAPAAPGVQQPANPRPAFVDAPWQPLQLNGLGIIAAGVTAAYLEEGLSMVARLLPEPWPAFGPSAISVLEIAAVHPLPAIEVQALLRHCQTIVVLEELEPFIEKELYVEARRLDFDGQIIGKLNGFFSRSGEYGVREVVRGVAAALDVPVPAGLLRGPAEAEALAAARPITVCAGCPHRGTFMAINQAVRKLRLKPEQVMVTGDIGCTILGMNPPFNTVWNEVAMGASIPLAQGYVHAGVTAPVIATIGDSTFFHAGLPGLINAIQHQVPLTLVIMDNGWTAMTGMQTNPGTARCFQPDRGQPVDIARIVPALGVEQFFTIDPFDLAGSTATLQQALQLPGVKVVLARQECAIQAMRHGTRAGAVRIVDDRCNLCKQCVSLTGCPALVLTADALAVDPALCYGCGLCAEVCHRDAIVKEAAA